jgi:hypothetical protein
MCTFRKAIVKTDFKKEDIDFNVKNIQLPLNISLLSYISNPINHNTKSKNILKKSSHNDNYFINPKVSFNHSNFWISQFENTKLKKIAQNIKDDNIQQNQKRTKQKMSSYNIKKASTKIRIDKNNTLFPNTISTPPVIVKTPIKEQQNPDLVITKTTLSIDNQVCSRAFYSPNDSFLTIISNDNSKSSIKDLNELISLIDQNVGDDFQSKKYNKINEKSIVKKFTPFGSLETDEIKSNPIGALIDATKQKDDQKIVKHELIRRETYVNDQNLKIEKKVEEVVELPIVVDSDDISGLTIGVDDSTVDSKSDVDSKIRSNDGISKTETEDTKIDKENLSFESNQNIISEQSSILPKISSNETLSRTGTFQDSTQDSLHANPDNNLNTKISAVINNDLKLTTGIFKDILNNLDKKLDRPLIRTVLEKNYVRKKENLEIIDDDKKNVEEVVELPIDVDSADSSVLTIGNDGNIDKIRSDGRIPKKKSRTTEDIKINKESFDSIQNFISDQSSSLPTISSNEKLSRTSRFHELEPDNLHANSDNNVNSKIAAVNNNEAKLRPGISKRSLISLDKKLDRPVKGKVLEKNDVLQKDNFEIIEDFKKNVEEVEELQIDVDSADLSVLTIAIDSNIHKSDIDSKIRSDGDIINRETEESIDSIQNIKSDQSSILPTISSNRTLSITSTFHELEPNDSTANPDNNVNTKKINEKSVVEKFIPFDSLKTDDTKSNRIGANKEPLIDAANQNDEEVLELPIGVSKSDVDSKARSDGGIPKTKSRTKEDIKIENESFDSIHNIESYQSSILPKINYYETLSKTSLFHELKPANSDKNVNTNNINEKSFFEKFIPFDSLKTDDTKSNRIGTIKETLIDATKQNNDQAIVKNDLIRRETYDNDQQLKLENSVEEVVKLPIGVSKSDIDNKVRSDGGIPKTKSRTKEDIKIENESFDSIHNIESDQSSILPKINYYETLSKTSLFHELKPDNIPANPDKNVNTNKINETSFVEKFTPFGFLKTDEIKSNPIGAITEPLIDTIKQNDDQKIVKHELIRRETYVNDQKLEIEKTVEEVVQLPIDVDSDNTSALTIGADGSTDDSKYDVDSKIRSNDVIPKTETEDTKNDKESFDSIQNIKSDQRSILPTISSNETISRTSTFHEPAPDSLHANPDNKLNTKISAVINNEPKFRPGISKRSLISLDKKLDGPLIRTVLDKNDVMQKENLETIDDGKKNVEEVVDFPIDVDSADSTVLTFGIDGNIDKIISDGGIPKTKGRTIEDIKIDEESFDSIQNVISDQSSILPTVSSNETLSKTSSFHGLGPDNLPAKPYKNFNSDKITDKSEMINETLEKVIQMSADLEKFISVDSHIKKNAYLDSKKGTVVDKTTTVSSHNKTNGSSSNDCTYQFLQQNNPLSEEIMGFASIYLMFKTRVKEILEAN